MTDLLALGTLVAGLLLLGALVATRWARTEVRLPDTSRGTRPTGG